MTDDIELDGVRVSASGLVQLDHLVEVSGGTRAQVASRLLGASLAQLGSSDLGRQQAYSLLDVDEDLVGP